MQQTAIGRAEEQAEERLDLAKREARLAGMWHSLEGDEAFADKIHGFLTYWNLFLEQYVGDLPRSRPGFYDGPRSHPFFTNQYGMINTLRSHTHERQEDFARRKELLRGESVSIEAQKMNLKRRYNYTCQTTDGRSLQGREAPQLPLSHGQ